MSTHSQSPASLAPSLLDPASPSEDNDRLLDAGAYPMSETIGCYRVLEPLGRGGMGIVYRARHVGSERAIALKTVSVPAPKWLDSIRREVQALTRIRHPGVVRIVDHGVHKGRPWYAMDLVEGESLRRFVQRIWSPYRSWCPPVSSTEALTATEELADAEPAGEPSPAQRPVPFDGVVPPAAGELGRALSIVRRLCATLAYLHGEGFVNGDLKPENVLLVREQPVIIDFGLTAHHPGGCGREALEAQRTMAGTLPYMSPEQIRGEFLDARSDLYSVGCMLYEMVTGVQPFSGSPRALIQAHLTAAPVPPSELVAGIPHALDHLILKLLAKDLAERYGYADEVAAQLAEIAHESRSLTDLPPARSYIYRPRLVGRDAVLAQLTRLREQAANGSGALVLLGGESGVGKTRLAMELTRVAPGGRMRIVTSEAATLSTEGAPAVAPAPLHALRSLLQAVADRCQEGGPDATRWLLGDWGALLAPYEPALAQVPGMAGSTPPIPLDVEGARRRLFGCLAKTLGRLADERPLLWVLDDLGWADELSLAFLRSLTAPFLQVHPLLIVGTYRTEEVSEGVAALVGLPHVTHVALPRLDDESVRVLIGDMLALRAPMTGFTDFVTRQAEGNPFFVAEYLRTAVAERILCRDRHHAWQLVRPAQGRPSQPDSAQSFETLSLPRSLRALIEQRVGQLNLASRQVAQAAAVLGRESDLGIMLVVAGTSEEAGASAVDELIRCQVLEPPGPERVRFAHDKLREVIYSQVPHKQLRELHHRAATALEDRWRDHPDASRQWATLGHHFAAAQESERAVHYLSLAADHARATYANGDAVRLYQEAINHANRSLLSPGSDQTSWRERLAALYEALGDVWMLMAQSTPARTAYEEALGQIPADLTVAHARLHRKVGKTWELQHGFEEAVRAYARAEDALQALGTLQSAEARNEWIQVQIDHLWTCYWLNDLPEMQALSQRLAPMLDEQSSPLQRSRYFDALQKRNLRVDRYIVREETLGFARAALAAAEQSGDFGLILNAHFSLGFDLVFSGQLREAIGELKQSLELAERAGDLATTTRCYAYLSLAARLMRETDDADLYAGKCAEAAAAAGLAEYLGAARATQGWVAMRRGDAAAAEQLANEALRLWSSLTLAYAFQWLALIPLLRISVARRDLERAVDCARRMVAPGQQYLDGAVWDALQRSTERWAAGDRGGAESALESALAALRLPRSIEADRSQT